MTEIEQFREALKFYEAQWYVVMQGGLRTERLPTGALLEDQGQRARNVLKGDGQLKRPEQGGNGGGDE